LITLEEFTILVSLKLLELRFLPIWVCVLYCPDDGFWREETVILSLVELRVAVSYGLCVR